MIYKKLADIELPIVSITILYPSFIILNNATPPANNTTIARIISQTPKHMVTLALVPTQFLVKQEPSPIQMFFFFILVSFILI